MHLDNKQLHCKEWRTNYTPQTTACWPT